MTTDAQRRRLHDDLVRILGAESADVVLELLPMDRDELATSAELRAVSAELRGEMAELKAELRGEMAGFKAELRGEMAELRAEMREFKAEIRGELKVLVPRLVTVNIVSMIGLSGLILAAGAAF